MPDFTVYFVPPAADPLYQAGSQLIGYDLRARKLTPEQNPLRAHFPGLDQTWVLDPYQYGFHMTIGHATHFEMERLSKIEEGIESILNLFDPAKPFTITPYPIDTYIRTVAGRVCKLQYEANQAFLMLHALIVSRVSPLGTGSPQLESFLSGATDPSPHLKHRLTQYFYHNLLDDFRPHFTLFGPLPTDDVEAVRAGVKAVIPERTPMTVHSLCLLVRPDGEAQYHIHREFFRSDYPKPLTSHKNVLDESSDSPIS